ncbi:LGFP repeat-containing protein [Sphingobacterium hotanense]|uniref:Uncharacterized protein n=1 Tax=Sphingobacterium hotanense TaxID=649196 RepID=A0ABT7NLE1_9SPHI|nr:hypothetical protein [Sphingobacterium hotanense]MDM1047971.1 hypothetical protein [Sphingobacterium hotanense]
MENFSTKIAELARRGFDTGAILSESNLPNGRVAICQNCVLYACPDELIFEVHGNILMKYQEVGETNSSLGYPRSDEMDDPCVAGGKVSYFEYGKISWQYPNGSQIEMYEFVDLDSYEQQRAPLVAKLQEIADYAFEALSEPQSSIENRIKKGSEESWCGKAVAYFYAQAGVPSRTTSQFMNTRNISLFGSYGKIAFDGSGVLRKDYPENTQLKEQHSAQDAARKMITFEDIEAEYELDILPGDIVLVDNSDKGGADHIQIVYKYNPETRMLTVVDGNGGGFALASLGIPNNDSALAQTAADGTPISAKKQWIEDDLGVSLIYQGNVAGHVGISCHILMPEYQVRYEDNKVKHKRVWAIVRPSILDLQ